VVDRLRALVREAEGRDPEPSAGIVDARAVTGAATVTSDTRGYDAGKKISGRKLFGVVDTIGLLLAVVVVAASTSDNMGGSAVVELAAPKSGRLAKVWHDAGVSSAVGAARPSTRRVPEVDDAVAEAAFVEQLQLDPDTSGQARLAAADDDREHEQVDLVHQPGREGVPGQARTADAEVSIGGVLEAAHGPGIELVLQPGAGRRHGVEGAGVDDLVEARHTSAKSSSSGAGASSPGVSAGSRPTVCQTAIVSYMRRPYRWVPTGRSSSLMNACTSASGIAQSNRPLSSSM
jgi:hypothetical protein